MLKYLLYSLSFFIFITTTQAQLGNYIGPTSTGNLGSEGAGQNITIGQYNVALGDSALFNLTTANFCTAIGYRAGYSINSSNSTGFQGRDNTFIGYLSGSSTTTGSDNTFVGKHSGKDNTTGRDNTFMGAESGRINTIGHDNTFFGDQTGYGNTTGDYNTFIGGDAGYNNTIGFRNTFLGRQAGYDNTTGKRNTCVGDSAGTDGGKGSHNTMIGQAAGPTTEHASYNTFIGSWAGGDNNRTNNDNGWDGMFNTALGAFAGLTNREGQGNVVMGYKADFTSSIGLNISNPPGTSGNNDNIAIGRQAIIGSTGIGFNGGIGKNGVITIGAYSRVNEDFGIAIGHTAVNYGLSSIGIGHLVNLTASMDSVVAIGDRAAVTGSNATSLGFKATAGTNSLALGANVTVTGNNSIAIGNGTTVSANNEVYLGNTSTASIGGVVNWTATSDGRFKTNVQENVPGLDFINNLRPVTYNFDSHKLNSFNQETALNLEKTTIQYTGFIAQEVEATALGLGYDFSGIKVPEDKETQMYGIRYAEFVVPLVKATQELSLLVQQQGKTIQDYRQQAELANQKMDALKAELEAKNKAIIDMKASLEQRIGSLENAIMSTTKAN